MPAADARPVPIRNIAFRATFPILDADGDLVSGAASLDSEVSGDGGTFADCTNEATEIATSSGMYFLDLTAGEMDFDTVAVRVQTGTAGAKTTPLVMYPNEAGDIDVDVTAFGGTAGTFAAGRAEVNVSHFGGTAGTFAAGRPQVNTSHVGGTLQTAGDIIADTDDIQTRLPAALVSGRMDSSVGAYAAGLTPVRPSATGTADSGSTTTVVDTERTEADTNYWSGCLIKFTSGTLNGQTRLITGFDAGTDTLTFAPALTVAASTHTYEIYPMGRTDLHSVLGSVINALIAGRIDANAQIVDGAQVRTAVGLAAANLDTQLATIDDFLDTEIAAILAAVDTEVAAILALLDDARGEPGQNAPPVNPDLATKIDYLYKSWRNRKTNNGTVTLLYADNGTTVDQRQNTSEAAGTVEKAEWITGP